ncbi:MAG: DUF3501 family protein [Gemmataceae bacterium]
MHPLTIDELLPLEEYVPRRREFFDAHRRYLEQCRRVRVGPRITLVFENRRTLWFRVQEILRIARIIERDEIQQELDLYNSLLPADNRLQAAMLIEIDNDNYSEDLARWHNLDGSHLRLCVSEEAYPATLITCRPEDRAAGSAHWVQFELDMRGKRLLKNAERPAWFAFDDAAYQHRSDPLRDEMRVSLAEDLESAQPMLRLRAG